MKYQLVLHWAVPLPTDEIKVSAFMRVLRSRRG